MSDPRPAGSNVAEEDREFIGGGYWKSVETVCNNVDGTFLGVFRMIAGGHVDFTDSFTDHNDYVSQITFHARGLQASGYLLEADADAIIQQAAESDIGR